MAVGKGLRNRVRKRGVVITGFGDKRRAFALVGAIVKPNKKKVGGFVKEVPVEVAEHLLHLHSGQVRQHEPSKRKLKHSGISLSVKDAQALEDIAKMLKEKSNG